MAIKIQGKEWQCFNQCKSNCCSEVFLPLVPAYKKMLEEQGYWIVNNNYTDFQWLGYHHAFILEKLHNGGRKISLQQGTEYKIIFNPFKGHDEIYVKDACAMLRPDNKCKIFRARPDLCRKALCPVFEKNPEIMFYAFNGVLKDKLEEVNGKIGKD